MQENSRNELIKEAFDLFCKLSDNQIMEILNSIKEDNEDAEQQKRDRNGSKISKT